MASFDRVYRQAVTEASSTAKHTIGTTMVDRDTGDEYVYVLHNAGSGTAALGVPCGLYNGGVNGAYVANTVTSDISNAYDAVVFGTYMGAVTDAYYCWVKRVVKGKECDAVAVADTAELASGSRLKWSADNGLTVDTGATLELTQAKAIESDGAGLDTVAVQWF